MLSYLRKNFFVKMIISTIRCKERGVMVRLHNPW